MKLFGISDEPEAPGKPEVVDWDKDHVDLKWEKPKSDGGNPIKKYVIEKKEKYGQWVPACEVPGDAETATVPDLEHKKEYEFRVKAVNDAGPSPPSLASNPQIAKPRFRE